MRLVRMVVGVLLVALPATTAAPDTLSVEWSAVIHESLAGYRVLTDSATAGTTQEWDVPVSQTTLTLDGLAGSCNVHCVSVKSRAQDGSISASSSPRLCGLADPEILAVTPAGSFWHIAGDNFSEDVEVYADGVAVEADRLDCGLIAIDVETFDTLTLRNPGDGSSSAWSIPYPGYPGEPAEPAVALLECRLVGHGAPATVTAFSQSAGLNVGIDADVPGAGTDCAEAVLTVIASPSFRKNDMSVLPLGEGGTGGLLYVFVAS